ncbi:hypothetical protein [Legionella clemsonensis]|uniref:Uncharacterized protein n=1 Tax=Legionella clemsonensis TaxID=1867846 RepID=A0A222P248_9GAMM|nr:hypothetical protein [Legionella clemsonensis]ASQ45930.1 hypothetical protein clem_06875 [Legionella clemsonensis]
MNREEDKKMNPQNQGEQKWRNQDEKKQAPGQSGQKQGQQPSKGQQERPFSDQKKY